MVRLIVKSRLLLLLDSGDALELLSWCYCVKLNSTLFPVASHSDGRTGQFTFGSEVLPVTLLDLPCVVESYKTYDDSHLVKMCDVGQVTNCLCKLLCYGGTVVCHVSLCQHA